MQMLAKALFQFNSGLNKKFDLSFNSRFNKFQWDLGVRSLLCEWAVLSKPKHFREDLIAGLVVACAAVPLSLAIALASGVSPATGLITAIIGGITCAFLGGTPLAVSGPAAAMAVLVNSVVTTHGLGGLLIVTIISGALQVFSGAYRLGKFIRFVPTPVVMGFTAGIGAIILTGQFPRALGLPAPDPSHICDVITHTGEVLRQAKLLPFLLTLATISIMFLFPKFLPKIPAALAAVSIPSLFAVFFKWNVETIGQIPNSLPLPQIPVFSLTGSWNLVLTGFTVYALASLETLLSSSAVDKLSKSKAHDSDQELIGQGLGNIASALFGGIPVTGVIARSALNVQAGAKTRRAAIFHSIFIVATVLFLSPVISQIPIAVLAGILLSVALRMLNPKELIGLWKTTKGDAVVYLVTFLVIVSVGLLAGVQAGVLAAIFIATLRLSQLQISALNHDHGGPFRVSLLGPMTFLSSSKLASLKVQLDNQTKKEIIFDFSRITLVDSSGGEQFAALLRHLEQKGCRVALLSAPADFKKVLKHELGKSFSEVFVTTEAEAQLHFEEKRPIHRLLHGVNLYRTRTRHRYESLLGELATGQRPHTLMITCADSRIDPNYITSTSPGEIFVVRNVGNLIPRYDSNRHASEQAALEYSLNILNVKELIVCGHSGCGAIQAMLNGVPKGIPGVSKWLQSVGEGFQKTDDVDIASRSNVLRQLENLMSYPVVREKVASKLLQLHAWFYDIKTGNVLSWDMDSQSFGNAADSSTARSVGLS